MKVAPAKFEKESTSKQVPLPLFNDESHDALKKKMKTAKFKLYSDPTDNTSPQYEFILTIIDETATVRHGIEFYNDIKKIIEGTHITTAANKVMLIRNITKKGILDSFTAAETKSLINQNTVLVNQAYAANPRNPAETQVDYVARITAMVAFPTSNQQSFDHGMQGIIEYLCPPLCLQTTKRYLRRHCRKPNHVTTRQFAIRLLQINEELAFLPPANPNNRLPADEINDILTNGIPKSWQREMFRQGYEPIGKTTMQVVAFLEQMEQADDYQAAPEAKKQKTSHKSSSQHASSSSKTCMIHGKGSHSTEECKTVKAMIANNGDQKKPSFNKSYSKKPSFKNKTWTKPNDKKATTPKDLKAYVNEAIQEAFANQLSHFKSDKSSNEDDKSVESMNNIETSIADFNYEDMDNIHQDSDDESEHSSN